MVYKNEMGGEGTAGIYVKDCETSAHCPFPKFNFCMLKEPDIRSFVKNFERIFEIGWGECSGPKMDIEFTKYFTYFTYS